MPEFLTDAWIDELARAAERSALPPELELVVQQVVRDGDREVAYVLEAKHGSLTVRSGRADAPDVTFTQDRDTAVAIARGDLSASRAFLDGRLALRGDLRRALPEVAALGAIQDAFAAARERTVW